MMPGVGHQPHKVGTATCSSSRKRFVFLTLLSNEGAPWGLAPPMSLVQFTHLLYTKLPFSFIKRFSKIKGKHYSIFFNPTMYQIRQLEFVKRVIGSLLTTGNAEKDIKRQFNQMWCIMPRVLGSKGKGNTVGLTVSSRIGGTTKTEDLVSKANNPNNNNKTHPEDTAQ